MRALHVVHDRYSPAELFVPPLEDQGFRVDTVLAPDEPLPESLAGFDAFVVGGGVMDVAQRDELPYLAHEIDLFAEAVRDGVPAVGLCLGAQLLTAAAGGEVVRSEPAEVGWAPVRRLPAAAGDPIAAALPERFTAFQWHKYACRPPAGVQRLAENDVCVQAFRVGASAWGTQFHIEVTERILRGWHREAAAQLAEHGWDDDRFEESLRTLLPPHVEIGQEMAVRFARLARERARRAA